MRVLCATAMLSALAVCPALAQTGTVVGRVVDVATGAPVIVAQVAVKGASAATLVDSDGRFRLTSIPSGTRALVARALGYAPVAIAFTVAPNGSTFVDVSMTVSSLALDAIVVTGAVGDTRRRAVGNSVAVVNASEIVGRSAVTNLTELLQA
ncbi:MAG: carboxypeptidase-like regulatory domain-containing protein, partial [Gemmatimonadaceae bacterium]